MIVKQEAVGLDAEVAQDVAVALRDGRGAGEADVEAQIRGRRLQAVAGQGHQDAAAAQPEPVGELDLAISVEDLGRGKVLGAVGIGFADVGRLEQDVEEHVLDH